MAVDNLDAIAAQMESLLSGVPCVSYRSTMELIWPILILAQPNTLEDFKKLRFFLVPLDDPDLTTKMVNTDRVDLLKAMACVAPTPHAQPGGRLSDAVGAALSLLQDVDVMTSTSHNVVWDHNYHQGPCKCEQMVPRPTCRMEGFVMIRGRGVWFRSFPWLLNMEKYSVIPACRAMHSLLQALHLIFPN